MHNLNVRSLYSFAATRRIVAQFDSAVGAAMLDGAKYFASFPNDCVDADEHAGLEHAQPPLLMTAELRATLESLRDELEKILKAAADEQSSQQK